MVRVLQICSPAPIYSDLNTDGGKTLSISTRFICALLAAVALATPAFAQQTTGTITGRVIDDQGAALPGATVIGKHTETGFTRASSTDAEGLYRLTALPVGTYDVTVELAGFSKHEQKGIILNVGQTLDVNIALKLASVQESVTVTGESPIIEASSSSVGGVVDVGRIENMPLNGRQFANLAATIPGVTLGYHSDPTKSTQYSPQIGGGNGRNVNYQIDGGDNNDDTVGGLLQLFPLEAIQEFNFVTSRYKAEYGRSNGGVMNIVTKSGTNDLHASWFTLFRDTAMNSITETEELHDVEKQDYRRYQFGGSVGGPIVTDKVHYFAAYERTSQDTFQVVNTLGLFPNLDGIFPTPYRENLFTVKGTMNLNPSHYVTVRYGRNSNTQPYGASPTSPPSNWGTSDNKFNSINANYNWVVGGSMLNEMIFQFADFGNFISANSGDPTETFPNGVTIGQNGNTPQTTQQEKYQFRNDFSWHKAGWGGIGHDFKVGFNYIHEPRLFITFNTGTNDFTYSHLTDDVNGPLGTVTRNGGAAEANIPLDQYAFYFQDDWRVGSRVTLNVGLRYDYIDGIQVDQSRNPNYVKVQAAGAAGQLAGIKGLENAGLEPKEDNNNWQPRFGMAWDVRGDGKDVVRAGWGIYQDVGYTNSNVLFPAIDATGIGSGVIFNVDNPDGIRNADGSLYSVGQPISNIASQNQANPNALPLIGQWLDPRLEMPYTRQTAVGWSHQLMANTVISVDFVRNDGRDLNTRPRLNTRPVGNPSAPRRLAFLDLQPNAAGTRAASSFGKSEYTALILGFNRRMTNGLMTTASYTLGEAKSTIGTAVDELNANNLQEAELLYDDPRAFGPTTRNSRHSGTFSAVWQVKGFTVAPIYIFRSPGAVATITGVDINRNGENNDLTARAYQFDGVGNAPKDIGACETWNCSRGAWRSQMNLRVSYGFRIYQNARIEAIGEVFNLFNAKNPGTFTANQSSSTFMQPQEFSGDFQNPEQRVGQIGFRFSF
jgi:outer membrane receptor protein involved in Fe transport